RVVKPLHGLAAARRSGKTWLREDSQRHRDRNTRGPKCARFAKRCLDHQTISPSLMPRAPSRLAEAHIARVSFKFVDTRDLGAHIPRSFKRMAELRWTHRDATEGGLDIHNLYQILFFAFGHLLSES